MADAFKLFGFEIKRSAADKKAAEPLKAASVVPPTDDDGAGYVTSPQYHYGLHMDIYSDLQAKDQNDLIKKYRTASAHPEVDMAIEEIVNESIVQPQDDEKIVSLDLKQVKISASVKKKVDEEFENILNMMTFNERAHDIFRNWYVDGRLYHHLVVDTANLKQGIQEIRYIDSLKIRKVRHVKKSDNNAQGINLVQKVDEFYIFNEKNADDKKLQFQSQPSSKGNAVKLSNDSVSYVTSGMLDEGKGKVVSHLHKAMRPINQLRMMEDALIIYRLARAPERRIFYVDTGNLPKGKAESYLNSLMTKYRNKLVYDQATGELRDSRKHMTMLDDFWLPRREGGRGTEVTTLPGGQNLGEIDDIRYFQRKVYQALNVPVSRLEQEQAYSLGRATEITREEIKFQKFVSRLRMRFAKLFTGILKQQLVLKGIITEADWVELFHNRIRVEYYKDNHYAEMKDAEVLQGRFNLMDQAAQYIGEYLSKEWVLTNILRMEESEQEEVYKQMQKELQDGEVGQDEDGQGGGGFGGGQGFQSQPPGQPPQEPSPTPDGQDEQ
jgi:hypothetical protein